MRAEAQIDTKVLLHVHFSNFYVKLACNTDSVLRVKE